MRRPGSERMAWFRQTDVRQFAFANPESPVRTGSQVDSSGVVPHRPSARAPTSIVIKLQVTGSETKLFLWLFYDMCFISSALP